MPARFLTSVFKIAEFPPSSLPQVAMVGRSNVGKSSLINHISGTSGVARTSAKAGLTQSMNLYDVDGRYLLVDLPGYGYARRRRSSGKGFEPMISEYLSETERLDLVLLVIDGRHGPMESDEDAIAQLVDQEIPFILVFNKTDKLTKNELAAGLRAMHEAYPDVRCIPHSVKENKGVDAIRVAINDAIR